MFSEDGQSRKHCFLAMFPEGKQNKKQCSLAMFPEGKQNRKQCFLNMFLEGEQTRNIVSQPSFLKVDKPGNVVSWPCFPKKKKQGTFLLCFTQVTQETTNDNYNNQLWQYINPESVMEWARTVVANRIAQDGRQWTALFSRYNSGT